MRVVKANPASFGGMTELCRSTAVQTLAHALESIAHVVCLRWANRWR